MREITKEEVKIYFKHKKCRASTKPHGVGDPTACYECICGEDLPNTPPGMTKEELEEAMTRHRKNILEEQR